MSEPIIVAGMECHLLHGVRGYSLWTIDNGEVWGNDGKWHKLRALHEVQFWPTEAAAREFALARSQPPLFAKDAAGLAIHAAAALARFSNFDGVPPEVSSAMCRKAVEIRDGIAALKRQSAGKGDADGWLPIDSAPKDGTRVLLCTASGDPEFYHMASWNGEYWQPFIPNDWTHWMPLPAARAGG